MVINIVVDLIILAIFVLFVSIGIRKGFLATVAKPIKLVASIGGALALCRAVSDKFIYSAVSSSMTDRMTAILSEKYSHLTPNDASELPTLIRMAAGVVGVDLSSISPTDSYISAVISAVTDPFIGIVCVIISFFVTFIFMMLALSFVLWGVNKIVDNGVVGIANRVLGCIFTSLLGFVEVWLIAGLVSIIFGFPSLADKAWVADFDGGFVYNFLRSVSPIDLLLSF